MSEQERYDALQAELLSGRYDGQAINGWASSSDGATLTVLVGCWDGSTAVIIFDATQVSQS